MENFRNEILNFWFGNNEDRENLKEIKNKLYNFWFKKSDDLDNKIKFKFSNYYNNISFNNSLDIYDKLAIIILYDQFSRNIFRNQSKAFEKDNQTKDLVLISIKKGEDKLLKPIERMFFYLPLEHSESKEIQELSLKKFKELADEQEGDWKDLFDKIVQYAISHKDIIDKFGRFPHRNEILGRKSTSEEIEFLKGPNSSF